MENKILNSGKEYLIKLLDFSDENIVQALCEQSPDYFEIVKNEEPGKDAGHEILTDLPVGKNISDKRVFGCFAAEGDLVAVADIIRDWKDKEEWMIGLLLILPGERNKGLGTSFHDFIKEYARANGAKKLRIAVVERNINAIIFWQKLGYQEVDRVKKKFGSNDGVVIIMNLAL